MDLSDWRQRIDGLNIQLLRLLNERAQCAVAIAAVKREKGLPIHDPDRERQVLEVMVRENTGPLSDDSMRRIFACIMAEHRRLEETSEPA
jgi:chorismate mutase